MATIVTRSGKGSPLTNTEVDANFTNLNTDKAELSGAVFTGAITTNSTFDGRDVATDGTKLDGIEASADVTDTTNVVAALSAGTGIGLSAGGSISNTAPDQTVALTGAGTTSVSGTYPNFTITGAGTTYTAGSGLSLTGTEFANTAPDQTVALTGSGATSISGTYPNFTITSTNTTYSVGDGGLTQINFTSADNTKLDGIAVNANNYTLPFTDNSTNWNTAYTYSQVGHLPLAGGTLTGDLLINSANAEVNLRSGAAGTSGAINWTFGTSNTNYASIKLPYDTRASTGLHIDSGYPITIDTSSSTGIKFVVNAANKATINSSGLTVSGTVSATGGNSANWNTAYGWGNHASAGYVSTTGNQNIDGIKIFTGVNVTLDNPVNSWKYIRLQSAASVKWDIATNEADTSGALQFRPLGSGANAAYVTTSGNYVSVPQGTLWGSSNDGSGSGLDADLLDGQQGNSYLRRDIPSIISVASSSADLLRLANSTSGQFIQIGFQQNDTDGMHHRAYLKAWKGSATASGNVDLIVRGSGGSLTSDVLSLRSGNASPTWRGQAIWNAGNDGAGSGLDADLLDGQQGSYYYAASNPSGYTTNTGTLTAETVSSTNAVTITGTKYFKPAGTVTTPLSGGGNASLQAYSVGGNYAAYMAFHRSGHYAINWGLDTSNNMVLGGWSAHASIPSFKVVTSTRMAETGGQGVLWGAANDGSGSGLDADLLDGSQGQYYKHPTSPMSQNVSFDSFSGVSSYYNSVQFMNIYTPTAGTQSTYNSPTNVGSHHHVMQFNGYSPTINNWKYQSAYSFYTGDMYTRNMYSSTWAAWRKQWDSVNDGSGSGLDADLLDGQQGSYYYPKSGGAITGAAQITFSGNNYFEVNSTSTGEAMTRYNNTTSDLWYTGIRSTGQLVGTTGYHIYSAAHGQTSFGITSDGYVKGARAGTFWGSSNDGSGSGLDADYVDGVEASSMVQLTATQTITGQKYFNSSRNTTSNSPPLQAYSSGGSGAIMSFHRGGYYAVNFGLDSDNVIRIGGWSAATNRFQMDMAGNLTMAGNITAYSDIRLKENIKVIPDALSKVQQLRGVTFTRNDTEDLEKLHTGVIAQEVEAVLPEAVSEDNDGIKNVAYGNMVGLLIESIKELKTEVDNLKTQLENK